MLKLWGPGFCPHKNCQTPPHVSENLAAGPHKPGKTHTHNFLTLIHSRLFWISNKNTLGQALISQTLQLLLSKCKYIIGFNHFILEEWFEFAAVFKSNILLQCCIVFLLELILTYQHSVLGCRPPLNLLQGSMNKSNEYTWQFCIVMQFLLLCIVESRRAELQRPPCLSMKSSALY